MVNTTLMPKEIPRPNLTAVLAVAALADLVLFRLVSHVFLPSHTARSVAGILSSTGLFLSNLGGVLGVVLFALVLLRAWRGDTIFPRSMRITISTIGLFFVGLAGAGVLSLPVSDYFVGYLRISHAFLALFIAVALWFRRSPHRLKLLATLFAAPVVVQTTSMFFERKGWLPLQVLYGPRMGQALAFSGLLLAPFLIPQLIKGRRAIFMLVGGILGLSLLALAMVRHYGLVQVMALYGLRFELPPATDWLSKAYAAVVAAAYVSTTVAVVACMAAGPTARLLGYGLVLLAVTGHQIAATNQTVFSICGLCALALGAARMQMAHDQTPLGTPEGAPEQLPSTGSDRPALN
jgi:hypothetical protein